MPVPTGCAPTSLGSQGCCGDSQRCGMVHIDSQGHGLGMELAAVCFGKLTRGSQVLVVPKLCAGCVILPSSWEVAFHSCCRQVVKKLC